MRYYLIVGEASGDLHASRLMAALLKEDQQARFRFFGGELMQSVGGEMVKSYKELAYMGFTPVLLHLGTILKNIKRCKKDIIAWQPDVVILVDYPGFNLQIAAYLHNHTSIPVFYYISPKVWAWKEYRVKNIKRDVNELFSILPFEVAFYQDRHHYPIHYIGNPTVDETQGYMSHHQPDPQRFRLEYHLGDTPIIAVLAGSRLHEIKHNLPLMLQAAQGFHGYQIIIAGAPGTTTADYQPYLCGKDVKVIYQNTYGLLRHAYAALVTSGTATLETALFGVPQVVCYHTAVGKLMQWLKKHVLKVRYISLVNLISNKEVVKELVADQMTVPNIRVELDKILNQNTYRDNMRKDYKEMAVILGEAGAASRAAKKMTGLLKQKYLIGQ